MFSEKIPASVFKAQTMLIRIVFKITPVLYESCLLLGRNITAFVWLALIFIPFSFAHELHLDDVLFARLNLLTT